MVALASPGEVQKARAPREAARAGPVLNSGRRSGRTGYCATTVTNAGTPVRVLVAVGVS